MYVNAQSKVPDLEIHLDQLLLCTAFRFSLYKIKIFDLIVF